MTSVPKYHLIRSNRSSIMLQIDHHGELLVKAPYLIPMFIINRFVNDKAAWIQKRLQLVDKIPVKKRGRITEGDEYPYLGIYYKLRFGNFSQINISDTINFPEFLKFRLHKELINWYKSRAKQIISARVEFYARKINTNYSKISFSDTSSQWGSCSRDNALQFNWRLVMAPILIIDYVVVHELVHTKIRNHQHDFWREVENYKPAYKQYVKWLRTNSHRLHAV
jgi:predicted metal-dependent hydrolase